MTYTRGEDEHEESDRQKEPLRPRSLRANLEENQKSDDIEGEKDAWKNALIQPWSRWDRRLTIEESFKKQCQKLGFVKRDPHRDAML